MELNEFVNKLKQDVENFHTDWIEENAKDDVSWPMQMSLADWYEQFEAFLGSP